MGKKLGWGKIKKTSITFFKIHITSTHRQLKLLMKNFCLNIETLLWAKKAAILLFKLEQQHEKQPLVVKLSQETITI
jgi:hypothetical protein